VSFQRLRQLRGLRHTISFTRPLLAGNGTSMHLRDALRPDLANAAIRGLVRMVCLPPWR
jgi:hypothetical protein